MSNFILEIENSRLENSLQFKKHCNISRFLLSHKNSIQPSKSLQLWKKFFETINIDSPRSDCCETKRNETKKKKKRKKEKEEKNSTTQQVEDARGSVGGRGNSKFRNKMYPIARGSRVEAATIGIISIGWADFRLILVSRAPTYCNHADILCSCNARSPSPLHPPPCTSASTYSTLRLPINALLRRR